ncbi:MAG: hypothetical protein HWQ43_13170 [Nostoc sp. JL31]|uniref:hypothetical protein n=1 Tax=Nostoc sp. JL31 TaxID=2815395 RepID=UPI0025FCAE50|nr:hypothetical protein [Nostoc sp. JL31]MBN3890073.1 hypothetical protein [Nostoc sp. JL31]
MKTQKVIQQSSMLLNSRPKLVLRRTRKRFSPKILIYRTIETTAIVSLLLTGFLGVGAIAFWGLEIIETNNSNIIISGWQYQKNRDIGAMLVSFSAFLGSSIVGASLSIRQDKF